MTVNYYYNNSDLTESLEITKVETFIRGTRRFLANVTPHGSKSSAEIWFNDYPETFVITLEQGKWYYSKDGFDIPYNEFKTLLSKFANYRERRDGK